MPYIITIKRAEGWRDYGDSQAGMPCPIRAYVLPLASRRRSGIRGAARAAVRPLSDGTVIEVRHVTRTELAELVGEDAPSVGQLVAAYNAKEQS